MGDGTGIWTTKVHQHPERAVPLRAQEFLAEGKVAHVGFMQDELPYVVPTLYHYSALQPDRIYLHGGMSSRMLAELAKGFQSASQLLSSTDWCTHVTPSITPQTTVP